MTIAISDYPAPPSAEPPRSARPRRRSAPPAPPPSGGDAMRPSFRAMQTIVQPQDLSDVFQPIVDMHTGRQFATEALVRCKRPELSDPVTLFRQAVAHKCSGRLGRMIREIPLRLSAGSPTSGNLHP